MTTSENVSARRLSRSSLLRAGGAAVAAGLVSCVLTPEQTVGPYYLDLDKVRRDITEGRPGTALTLRPTVVNASTCKPIKNAAVDVWHCDGFSQEGTSGKTYLRGIQRTNANGVATFKTIYPGWYRGRTVHIHVRVHIGGSIVHTGQLYFPEAVSDAVYTKAPYAARGARDTKNAVDMVFRNGGPKSMLELTRSGTGWLGTGMLGVQRS